MISEEARCSDLVAISVMTTDSVSCYWALDFFV